MTADIRRQLEAQGVNPANLAQKQPTTPRKPLAAPKEPQKPAGAGRNEEIDTTPPATPATCYYIGPYQLQVASGTHYPGRVRCVIVGPAHQDLPAALVAALTQFVKP